jgi:hypothetical protein
VDPVAGQQRLIKTGEKQRQKEKRKEQPKSPMPSIDATGQQFQVMLRTISDTGISPWGSCETHHRELKRRQKQAKTPRSKGKPRKTKKRKSS